ncbi:hypothetical protein FRB98_005870 [Tulasnella sp. 332]|nr:hypothetical protein FRB98_005870 [Tulasnella sp. 332]
MSASRRAEDQSTTRRTNRHQNSSPYPKKKPAAPAPSKQSSGIKATSTFVSLFSFLNPFRSRDETPPAVPQRQKEQQNIYEQSFDDDYEQDVTEAEGVDDTQYHEKQPVNKRTGLSSSNSSLGRRINQIPFPLVSSPPQKRTNDGTGPSTPNSSRNIPPPPSRNLWATPSQQQQSSQYKSSPLHNMSPLAASASIQDLLGERVKAGVGLTSEEAQQLFRVVSAAPSREAPMPTAAYLGRDFVPSPSRSFLAPPPPLQNAASSQPFTFTSARSSASTSSSTTQSKTPRRRPVYVGPGQSLNSASRSPRTGMGLRATSSNLDSLAGPSSSLSRNVTMNESSAGPDAKDGKRRRVEGMIGPQSGLGLSSSQSIFGVNSAAAAEPESHQVPIFTFSSDDFGGGKRTNGISFDKGKDKEGPHARQQPSVNDGDASTTGSTRRTSLAVINTSGFLKPTANPTPSPAVPSPLRNVTKPIDSPSPPRRSRTSATVLDIIKDVDHELKTSASNSMDVDDFVNPYESQGPKPPPIIRSKKKPAMKKPLSPPPEPPRKSALPSSVQAIADSFPSKNSIPVAARSQNVQSKASAEQTRRKDQNTSATTSKSSATTARYLSKQTPQPQQSKSSPFLPPTKTNGSSATTTKNTGKYTIYDVDEDDDDGLEIQELPSPLKKVASSKPNGFSSSSRSSPPPPPILISEMDVDEEQDPASGGGSKLAQKPSLVIEPGEPSRRLGRSPSLGPPGNLYSPTIPSPLRLVSMPEPLEQEQEGEVIEIEKDELEEDNHMEKEDVKQAQEPKSTMDMDFVEKRNETKDPKESARNAAASVLPTFKFDSVVFTVERTGPGVDAARKAAVDVLPKFAFSLTTTVSTSTFNALAAKPTSSGEWTCDTCMLKNPASATSKCTICDATRPAAAKPTPSTTTLLTATAPVSFDWAASGFAPKVADGTWTCSTCSCSNPAAAKLKCTVCETPVPDVASNATTMATSAPPAAPPIAAFNWSAAGFAAKAPAPGTWTCSTCQLNNPADVAKCTICGEVKV